jgi:hypothetical protein
VSDANDTAKIRPFKNTKNRLLRVMTVLRPRGAPVYWVKFSQQIWVNYGIGWSGASEASDANDTAKIRPFKNTNNRLLRVMTVLRRACVGPNFHKKYG